MWLTVLAGFESVSFCVSVGDGSVGHSKRRLFSEFLTKQRNGIFWEGMVAAGGTTRQQAQQQNRQRR